MMSQKLGLVRRTPQRAADRAKPCFVACGTQGGDKVRQLLQGNVEAEVGIAAERAAHQCERVAFGCRTGVSPNMKATLLWARLWTRVYTQRCLTIMDTQETDLWQQCNDRNAGSGALPERAQELIDVALLVAQLRTLTGVLRATVQGVRAAVYRICTGHQLSGEGAMTAGCCGYLPLCSGWRPGYRG